MSANQHTARFILGSMLLFTAQHAFAQAQDASTIEQGDVGPAPAPAPTPAPATQAAPAPVALEEPAADVEPSSDTDSGSNPLDSRADVGLVIGGKVGGGLGKPFSKFGATPVFELELGYMLPLGDPIGRSIELFVTGQFTQPGLDGNASDKDSRLPGDGILHYDVTQQELALSLGALYRFDLGSKLLMPYGGLGGRMYLLNTKVKASAGGQSYGQNEEKQTKFGLVLLGGVDIFVGPGALLAELSFGWASLDGYVLRNTNLGALSLAVGYRLMF